MEQRFLLCLLLTLSILSLFPASTWSQHQEEHEHKDLESHKSEEQHSMPMGEGEGSVMMMEHESKYALVPWKAPDATISPPPPLMGKQMGQVHTLNVPPLGYEMDGDVKVFNLTVQPVERYLTDGRMPDESIIKEWNRFIGGMHHNVPKKVKLWGYNGSVPGPTIEAVEGDTIRVIMKNELPEPTSIHWHGLEVPNEQDGAGGHSEPPTPPGGTRVYEFVLHQVGTFMYHTGFNVMKQDGMGLGGLVVIHPREPEHKIDKDVAIMLQAFAFLPGNDQPDLVTMDFNWFTFDGKVAPDIEYITVKQGERVRLRFGNLTMHSHLIHVHGYTWKVVGTEGGPIPEMAQWPGSTINVPPGTTRDVEFVAWNPGVWRLHCHKLHHIVNAHADIPNLNAALQHALDHRPDIQIARLRIKEAERALRLEKTRILKHLDLSASYEKDADGSELFGPGVDLQIPIFDQNRASIAKFRYMARKAERDLQALEGQIREEIAVDLERVSLYKTKTMTYQEKTIPLNQKAIEYAGKWVGAMQLSRLYLLETQKELLESQKDYLDALIELRHASLDLERHLGGSLP